MALRTALLLSSRPFRSIRDFGQLRAMTERVADQILYRYHRFLFRQSHGGGGESRSGPSQGGIFERAAECILHQQLLQLQIGLS